MSVDEEGWLAGRFEENRKHLRAVAYRMLGSLSEADDAVQEAWLRLSRSDASSIGNLAGWLTTVVARVSVDMLRARRSRAEEPVGARLPDPIISREDTVGPEPAAPTFEPVAIDARKGGNPEQDAIMADSISLALLVVLETLAPSERLAFVLHDMFDVPFDEIAPIMGKTPAAARQLASRARRRVHGASTPPDADISAQREVVAAFLAAARSGDFDALLRMLDPDVVVRADLGTTSQVARGAESAAKGAITGTRLSAAVQLVIVNGAPGIVSFNENGDPRSVVAFTVRRGKITEINVLADPDRLRHLDLDLDLDLDRPTDQPAR
jgi:RNA polymerase sigma factor (sigma-70 family)